MHHLQLNKKGPLQIFYDQFEDYLSMEDYFQFFANRQKSGKSTFLSSDVFQAEKLSTVMIEEYSARGKLAGNVILAFPEPDFDVPIFTFQLGGNEKKSIALLDISPTLPDTDYTPLIPVFEKYKKLLNMEPSTIDWVKSICSPYLLHSQYEVLDIEVFLAATKEYLATWVEHYYKPGARLSDERAIATTTNAIMKYKLVLHDNDPAYGIFHKEWGEPMADAFYNIETRDYPSVPMPDHSNKKLKRWENKELNILWDRGAQERVLQAPEPSHKLLIDAIEAKASQENMFLITLELFEKYESALPAWPEN